MNVVLAQLKSNNETKKLWRDDVEYVGSSADFYTFWGKQSPWSATWLAAFF